MFFFCFVFPELKYSPNRNILSIFFLVEYKYSLLSKKQYLLLVYANVFLADIFGCYTMSSLTYFTRC